jgi:hypothetical protein
MVDHCGFYIVREAISQLTVSHNMTKMVDIGNRYGIPTLAVTAVGRDMARDARYSILDTGCWMLDAGC